MSDLNRGSVPAGQSSQSSSTLAYAAPLVASRTGGYGVDFGVDVEKAK